MAIKKPLSKSLGIHAPSRFEWKQGLGDAWLNLHDASHANGAILTFKRYDEPHIWESGKGLEPRASDQNMLDEARILRYTPVLSWIPFTASNPAGPLTNYQRDSIKKAAAHLHTLWPSDVVFSFANHRGGTNWFGTDDQFFAVEADVYEIWTGLGRTIIPVSDCGVVFDAFSAQKRASSISRPSNYVGTHAYGKDGFVARHVSDFNDAIDHQLSFLRTAITPVFLEIHRWFPEHTESRDANPELFTAETGAYLLGLKKEADRIKAELAFFTVDMFFNENGTANKAGLALAGKITATAWQPEGAKNYTYQLRKLAGDSEITARYEAMRT